MTTLYQIKDHQVPLFPMRYIRSIFGCSRSGILQKERRGQLPTANWRDGNSCRMYSIEDLGVIEYIYKEIWPYRMGVPTPDFVKEMVKDALAISKKIVLEFGESPNADSWEMVHKKYNQFNKYRCQIYIETWKSRLLNDSKFFEELVDEY
jgi:hypothetical protein